MDNKSLNVVYMAKDGPLKMVLSINDIKTNESGQYLLPPNFYSAGYYERMCNMKWEDLLEPNKQERDYILNLIKI